MRCTATFLVIAIFAMARVASAVTYTVHPDGTGDFPTIQSAIDGASNGDVIELMDGIFTGDGNRDIDYMGKAITVSSQSGDPETCVIDCQGGPADLHRGFYFHSGEQANSVIEGVTITNGYQHATEDDFPDNVGGGLLCLENSSPTVINCILADNSASSWGGGMFGFLCSPTINSCRFFSNVAGHSGGALGWGGEALTLTGCTFSGNSALGNESDAGGGALICAVPNLMMTDCHFTENEVVGIGAGGALLCRDSSPTLVNCTLSGNVARVGGGLYCLRSPSTLTECTFSGNTAVNLFGGAMACRENSPATLTNCTLSDNVATGGGGMACWENSPPTLTNCTLSDNSSSFLGGGMYCEGDSPPTLTNCTLFRNTATAGGGGMVCEENSPPTLTNCTLSDNSSDLGGGMACGDNSSPTLANTIIAFSEVGEAIYCEDNNATLTCCDVYGNAGGDWVGCIADQYGINGNISEDPLFCDPENEDFTLHADSPCAPFSPPNEECDLIGAWPVACGSPTAVTETTWGRIKAKYQ